MRTDALDIDRFYRTQLGQMASEMVRRRLRALWPDVSGLDVMAFGYGGPYLAAFQGEARRTIAYMPAAQGAVVWPNSGLSLTALGDEHRLPFPEAMFDRIILVHALEEAHDNRRLLREVWRVLAPEGRLVTVVTHRGGLWSLTDSTPFGHGRPFTRRQLNQVLQDTLFEPTAFSRAVFAPPWRWASGAKLANSFEQMGGRFMPGLGGLVLVEAVKHVGAVRPGGHGARVRHTRLETATKPSLSPHSHNVSNDTPPVQDDF